MPEPTMTMSASEGRCEVVRWPRRKSEGSLCQNEDVDSVVGKLAIFYGLLQSLVGMMIERYVWYHTLPSDIPIPH